MGRDTGCYEVPDAQCTKLPVQHCIKVQKCNYKPEKKCKYIPIEKCIKVCGFYTILSGAQQGNFLSGGGAKLFFG